MKSICVFCGSADHLRSDYLEAAAELGRLLAASGMCLVYGGGSTGIMGSLASAAMQSGGEVVGVIPEFFNTDRLAHAHITRMEVVPDLHRRKARFAELADGFIMLPGGLGTLEEFFEVLTWAQVGLHRKPIGILNTAAFFAPLLAMLEHACREGFLYKEHLALFACAAEPADLLDAMRCHTPPAGLQRWVERG